ncbi:hypothetical protein GCM10011363_29880 [Marivita lacus]|uniref:Peptidase M10 serralysin C-terminal domain-containing protein n=2 Tax=Marivita lacus TaxID=1323742 RepID=A0ABQ1KXS1_9RHOB|nr:hypothetical protein GCM10011363_29880 [Marivita lacus]
MPEENIMSNYSLQLSTTNVWKNGFIMELTLTNAGPETVIAPFVDLVGTARIVDLWGGDATELDNGMYRINFADQEILPGETARISFKGEGKPDLNLAEVTAEPNPVAPTPDETEPVEQDPTDPAPTQPALDGPTVSVHTDISAQALEAMIRNVDAGTVFQLEAGTYRFDATIDIDRSDVALIGAGSGQTRIELPSNLNKEAFDIGDGARTGDFTLASNVVQGYKILELNAAHSFVAGDFIYLARESTEAFYDSIGDETWRNTDVALRTSIAEVSSVTGNTVTLKDGVHFDFTTSETRVQEIDMAQNVTLGGFEIDYGLGHADPSAFDNRLSGYNRDAVIQVEGTSQLNLFDIVAKDIPSLGVNVALSTYVAADGLTMTGAHNKGSGGNGYALQIRDVYDSSFVNLWDMDMRHSVVFASWRSAADNLVHVTRTDRDINFHGGRDHGNTVWVDESVRDANSDIIAPTLFLNEFGTHYGSVTDADANQTRFGKVIGTRLGDEVQGYDNGSWLDGRGGNDTLTGGSSNDVLIGGDGRDLLTGGAGEDMAIYTGNFSDFRITDLGGGLIQLDDRAGSQSRDAVDVEWAVFDDGALRMSDMAFLDLSAVEGLFGGAGVYVPAAGTSAVAEPKPADVEDQPDTVLVPDQSDESPANAPVLHGTDGKDTFEVSVANTIVHGGKNWDVVKSSVDFTMLDDVEKLELMGTGEIDAIGSGSADLILGNDADNVIRGNEGEDRIWARDGDDVIVGGGGADDLNGGNGADIFRFEHVTDSTVQASDSISDFVSGTDTVELSLIDADSSRDGHQAFQWNGVGAAALWQSDGFLLGDINGDGSADMSINLLGVMIVAQDLML